MGAGGGGEGAGEHVGRRGGQDVTPEAGMLREGPHWMHIATSRKMIDGLNAKRVVDPATSEYKQCRGSESHGAACVRVWEGAAGRSVDGRGLPSGLGGSRIRC